MYAEGGFETQWSPSSSLGRYHFYLGKNSECKLGGKHSSLNQWQGEIIESCRHTIFKQMPECWIQYEYVCPTETLFKWCIHLLQLITATHTFKTSPRLSLLKLYLPIGFYPTPHKITYNHKLVTYWMTFLKPVQ